MNYINNKFLPRLLPFISIQLKKTALSAQHMYNIQILLQKIMKFKLYLAFLFNFYLIMDINSDNQLKMFDTRYRDNLLLMLVYT